ncbi:hypothetical protein LCGC14_0648160 [marine sediment metagenome]|uniref:Uncharacterized protein n=1 Tax=marine sediment metagenome TaxID=412755 RepID=A0A0F9U5I6_9ZZZZ
MALLNAEEVLQRIVTDLESTAIDAIIAQEEAEIIRRFGDDASTPVVDTIDSEKKCNVYLDRRFASITTVTEGDRITQVTVDATGYQQWPNEGRLERIGTTGLVIAWQSIVVVTYLPEDDKTERQRILLELIRLAMDRQAMKSESVGQSDYIYKAPEDWEREREKILAKLNHFVIVG